MLIEVTVIGNRIDRVTVSGDRPPIVSHLRGQPSHVVQRTLPLMHAVCARAHAAAVAAALKSARDGSVTTTADSEVAAEAAREQLLAILTGPAKFHLPQAVRSIGTPGALRELFSEWLLGMAVEDWLALDSMEDVMLWTSTSSSVLAAEFQRRLDLGEPSSHRIAVLPVVDAAESLRRWSTPTEALRVDVAQTGAISRELHHPLIRELQARPLLQRWLARVRDVARYASGDPQSVVGRVSAVATEPGRGRSIVETARGMLMHEVGLDGDVVTDYAIVTPTQQNLHPDGAVRRWLEGTRVASEVEALDLARRAIEALDPCLEWQCAVVRGGSRSASA